MLFTRNVGYFAVILRAFCFQPVYIIIMEMLGHRGCILVFLNDFPTLPRWFHNPKIMKLWHNNCVFQLNWLFLVILVIFSYFWLSPVILVISSYFNIVLSFCHGKIISGVWETIHNH